MSILLIRGQDAYSIINELRNTFQNYEISIMGNSPSNASEVRINYDEPIITIQFFSDRTDRISKERFVTERKISFDVLKSNYYDTSTLYYYSPSCNLEILCPSGIDVYERSQYFSGISSYSSDTDNRKLETKIYLYSQKPIVTRLLNAFSSLKNIAKEKGVKKSAPNILDDAELAVQSISFVAPDNTGKLKANQTGCIKVEVKNTNSNNALNVACVVKEKNKSELFSYEQYNSVKKIMGYETEIINIPIKASENVDNGTYPFEVMVTYNGKTIKTQTLSITASNPQKRPAASSTSGISRNITVRMRKMAGNTYVISCKVNGLPLDFIFDTGASSVTLSKKQAMFMLKNGYLSKSDIVGSNAYQTASGDIAIGTVVKLKKIEINGLILNNVEASIINSDSAPLLLGQSALSRLGKIQIDYRNSTLTIIR